jgi:hypothetical protein
LHAALLFSGPPSGQWRNRVVARGPLLWHPLTVLFFASSLPHCEVCGLSKDATAQAAERERVAAEQHRLEQERAAEQARVIEERLIQERAAREVRLEQERLARVEQEERAVAERAAAAHLEQERAAAERAAAALAAQQAAEQARADQERAAQLELLQAHNANVARADQERWSAAANQAREDQQAAIAAAKVGSGDSASVAATVAREEQAAIDGAPNEARVEQQAVNHTLVISRGGTVHNITAVKVESGDGQEATIKAVQTGGDGAPVAAAVDDTVDAQKSSVAQETPAAQPTAGQVAPPGRNWGLLGTPNSRLCEFLRLKMIPEGAGIVAAAAAVAVGGAVAYQYSNKPKEGQAEGGLPPSDQAEGANAGAE